MAIVKVGTYRNPPEDITDYEAIVSHLEAYTRQVGNQGMILTEWTNNTTQPKIAMGSYISHGGVLYVVDAEDYGLPALSSDGTFYLRVAASGDTLALSWISSLSGYAWNAIANGLYHADESQVLPYMLVVAGAVVEKWKITNLMQGSGFSRVRYDGAVSMGSTLAVTGAISGASINTGSGAMTFDQGVKTTDIVKFANLNPPVDNNDATPPDIGIGGFTVVYVASSATYTLPATGTYIVLGTFTSTGILRYAGGTVLTNDWGSSQYFMIFRIS